MSIESAILKFSKKQLKQEYKKRGNHRDLEGPVVSDCLNWCRENNFDVDRYESGHLSPQDRMNIKHGLQHLPIGTPDIVGNDGEGFFSAIEVKAPGKQYNLSTAQYHFLIRKIEMNCFAVVVDSSSKLNLYYNTWKCIKRLGAVEARKFLIDKIPARCHLKFKESDKLF